MVDAEKAGAKEDGLVNVISLTNQPAQRKSAKPLDYTTTAEILNDTSGRNQMSLFELPRKYSRLDNFFDALWGWLPDCMAMDSFLQSEVKHHVQFEKRLAPLNDVSHDVYLVCRPHDVFLNSRQHWSVYTQGHFYHLGKPRLSAAPSDPSRDNRKKRSQAICLRHENLSSEHTPDYKKRNTELHSKKILVAYHVRQTDYTPSEVLHIAHWIITQMAFYDVFRSSCQKFVFSLVMRIVMTKRDWLIFIGTAIQIANWDLCLLGSNALGARIEKGFIVFPPPTRLSVSLLSDYLFSNWLWLLIRTNRKEAASIRERYEKRKGAILTFEVDSPACAWTNYRLRKSQPKADRIKVKAMEKEFRRKSCTEFWDDLKASNWSDALFGRVETSREYYEREKESARNGDVVARMFLPLERLMFRATRWDHT